MVPTRPHVASRTAQAQSRGGGTPLAEVMHVERTAPPPFGGAARGESTGRESSSEAGGSVVAQSKELAIRPACVGPYLTAAGVAAVSRKGVKFVDRDGARRRDCECRALTQGRGQRRCSAAANAGRREETTYTSHVKDVRCAGRRPRSRPRPRPRPRRVSPCPSWPWQRRSLQP